MRQEYKTFRPTLRPKIPSALTSNVPTTETNNLEEPIISCSQTIRCQYCFLTITTKEEGTSYSDLAGQYPITSSRGYKYMLCLYDYDSNSIQWRLLKTRQAAEIKRATLEMLEILAFTGFTPKMHILDNEASADLKKY